MIKTITTAILSLLLPLCGHAADDSAKKNVLLICIDDLRPELGCYGKDYIKSPNIDRLASEGRRFSRHYVQAPSCGPSRYSLLTGLYGSASPSNGELFQRAENLEKAGPSLPAWLRDQGYNTVSIGKVSHHPGGWGGPDWDDTSQLEMPGSWTEQFMPCGPWKHPRGAMHGLANGEIRGPEKHSMAVFQSHDGPDDAYPDGLITEKGIAELTRLASDPKPFFLAIGLIRPHLPFGAPARYMEGYKDAKLPPIPHPEKPTGKTTWGPSGEFKQYDHFGHDAWTDPEHALAVRKHYAACVSYADSMVGQILAQLETLKIADDTIVVLWGDHGWHLGEHAVWGKHTLFEESLHSPLIVRSPGMKKPGEATDQIAETVDLYPTLCELVEIPVPENLSGQSLVAALNGDAAKEDSALSQWGGARSLRTGQYRLTLHKNGYVELYDHDSPEGETRNIATEEKELVEQLKLALDAKLR
ncbi:sulfatase [Haloferula chungangensis]|uniref:Sulfatase n=1 Tax=Haloferula chungangensis TaxID=1048331 RepID=A0ABW2LC79_9BACT